jgi:hypothetical protein
MDVIWEANLRDRIYPDAHTLTPEWRGEPVDVGWVIDVLHPLANPLPDQRLDSPLDETLRALDADLSGDELRAQGVAQSH